MIGAYSGYQTELSNLIIELRDGENLTYKQIADHLTAPIDWTLRVFSSF
jgi:hypothetical protein